MADTENSMTKPKAKNRKRAAAVAVERVVSLRLNRDDMLQVWRDSIVGHQTAIISRQKKQYERIVTACDAILYPKPKRSKQANDPSSATAATRRTDCNRSAMPPFAAAHG